MPMTDDEIVRTIHSFPAWMYEFDLRGHKTPVEDRKARRHPERKAYFFDPLVGLFGGSLKGKRVLDLACSAGYWSLHAIEAGADKIVGIEARQMHFDQASFVFKAKDIDPARYTFVHGNIFEVDFAKYGPFDIVLCLGIMYHITRHTELFEKISRVNTDVLLVDTRISTSPDSILEIRRESIEDHRNAVESGLVMFPSRQAVIDMAGEVGYQVAVLKPQFTDGTHSHDFTAGARRAFVCSKRTDLAGLPMEVE
jgi:SAM-dependent methyltransferase